MSGLVTDLSGNSPVQLPYIAASATSLNQLAQSLNSYPTKDVCGNLINTAATISAFLNNQSDPTCYETMSTSIKSWLDTSSNETGPFTALGLNPSWNTSKGSQYGIRVQVIFANGQTAFDSNAGSNNIFGNINKPKDTFLSDGKWLINENQSSRSYNMGAQLSNSGFFYQTAHSGTVKKQQMYLAMRQGISPTQPLGNLVISMNTEPTDLNPVPIGVVDGDQPPV
jgi:hypothetical protein